MALVKLGRALQAIVATGLWVRSALLSLFQIEPPFSHFARVFIRLCLFQSYSLIYIPTKTQRGSSQFVLSLFLVKLSLIPSSFCQIVFCCGLFCTLVARKAWTDADWGSSSRVRVCVCADFCSLANKDACNGAEEEGGGLLITDIALVVNTNQPGPLSPLPLSPLCPPAAPLISRQAGPV